MKIHRENWFRHDEGAVMAFFDDSRLVNCLDGRFKLLGGRRPPWR